MNKKGGIIKLVLIVLGVLALIFIYKSGLLGVFVEYIKQLILGIIR